MDITELICLGDEVNTSLTRILTCVSNAADLLDFGMDIDEMRESLEDAGREIMKVAEIINAGISRFAVERGSDG